MSSASEQTLVGVPPVNHWSTVTRRRQSGDVASTLLPSHLVSPDIQDVLLGAETKWPDVPSILVLDSYPWTARSAILTLASTHSKPVWILRQEEFSHAAREDLTV